MQIRIERIELSTRDGKNIGKVPTQPVMALGTKTVLRLEKALAKAQAWAEELGEWA
jgi:hypothetical protein